MSCSRAVCDDLSCNTGERQMNAIVSGVDVLVIVPFQPPTSLVSLDPKFRQTVGSAMSLPLSAATLELEAYIGRSLSFWEPGERPSFDNELFPYPDHRSLTAISLATSLENAGLSWKAIDPGTADLATGAACCGSQKSTNRRPSLFRPLLSPARPGSARSARSFGRHCPTRGSSWAAITTPPT